MTIPTPRYAGWLTGLSLGCLIIAGVTGGPATSHKEVAVGEPQAAKDLKAKFHQDFRTSDYDPDFLFPVGEAEISQDEKGLRITFPAGQGKLQDTRLGTLFFIRGEFEATVSFELLKADQPKAGAGVGIALYAWIDAYGRDAISLARRLLPDGKTVFMCERLQIIQGKRNWKLIKSLPATAAAGKLRLERHGALLRCCICAGDKTEFITVAEVDVTRADVNSVSLGATRGDSESALDVRLLDFSVRAEALPGLSDLGQKQAAEPLIQRLGATQAAALEEKLQKLYARLAPSVVRILKDPKNESGFSGVLISSSGEILTVAHHGLAPKTKVTVELSDGRLVKGTVLGSVKQEVRAGLRYPAADVGMVILDEKDDWPAATLGSAADLKVGDFCLAVGNPNFHKRGQPPLLRLGRMLASHQLGMIRTSCRIQPGDSGGPLFDLDGRVLGVAKGIESLKTGINWHSPVEGFLKVRDRLRAGEEVEFEKELPERREWPRDPGGAWEATVELTKTLSVAHKSTVQVLGDGKVIALGVIVGEDGWVLTKRTELTAPSGPRTLVCRLPEGRKLEAKMMGESREHDLALLKVPAKGLPAVQWGKSDKLGVGQLVASLGPGTQPLHYGVVGALRVKNPGTKGDLPIQVKPASEGVRGMIFSEFLPKRLEIEEARGLLKAGDLITHLDGIPIPSADEFARVRDKRTAEPNALAGEWIKLTLEREGKTRQVFLPLVEKSHPILGVWRLARWNVRRNGFPNVFSHDGGIAHDRCGGAVVDQSGQVIGINIARADTMQTFAIPSAVVQDVIAEMKAQTQR